MQSFNSSRLFAIGLLFSLAGGVIAGCASPALEHSQPQEIDKPDPMEIPTMTPSDPKPKEAEDMQSVESPDSESLLPVSPDGKVAHSAKTRTLTPDIDESGIKGLNAGNRAFAADLYQALRSDDGNLFFSPYSISLALAMAYGGARGETAAEMAEILHFSLPDENIHAGFNALDLALASRNNEDDKNMPGFKLNIANSAWAQYDRPFAQDYLDLLAENYDAGLHLTDYVGDPEGSRIAINEWVDDETEGKIKDLIPAGVINPLTRLVLANAIYFNAGWQTPFNQDLTKQASFTLLDEDQISVAMMSTSDPERFGYTAGEAYQAVELPYNGGQLSMVILLPTDGMFESFEASLDADKLAELLENMETRQVELQMPKFSFESQFGLVGVLKQLGMSAAFDPQAADFSGIDGTRDLSISDVIHKAFVSVDEKGTEAAAATAVIIGLTSMPVTDIQLTIDRPFIFLIQDKPTGTILFLGRVLDPTK